MNVLKNVFAVLAGLIIGSALNMALIVIGPNIIPPPEGVDVSSIESLKANMHLFQARHFLFPFLAHALGTLLGAFVAIKIGRSHHQALAATVVLLFLAGGITNVISLPAPLWFELGDLVLAYMPMGYLAWRLNKK